MNVGDYIVAYKILKDLGTPWVKFKAYELGLINDKGEKLQSPKTSDEKEAFSSYNKIIFNMKRLLQKVVGKNNLAQQVVSLFLLKESSNVPTINENVIEYIIKHYKIDEFTKCGAKINESHADLFVTSFLEANVIDYSK